MTNTNVADILIAVAVIVWVIYRQLTWQLVNPSRLWRMPIVVAVVGIVMLAQTKSLTNITGVDLAILAGELVLSLGIGAAMGTMARFRSRPQRASDVATRRDSGATFNPAVTVIESRTGGAGAALWLVLIVVRVGIEIAVTQYFHSAFLASTGTVLIVLAANRAARALVVTRRMEQNGIAAA